MYRLVLSNKVVLDGVARLWCFVSITGWRRCLFGYCEVGRSEATCSFVGIAYYEENRMFWSMQVALRLWCWVQSYDASVNQTKDLQRFCLIHTLRQLEPAS